MSFVRNSVVFAFSLLLAGNLAVVQGADRPNIVFLLTDDQRFDAVGYAEGDPHLKTPALDQLAADGTVFENAFVTTSICAISRASILTGQYESRHGVRGFGRPLSPEQLDNSFPTQLRSAGYYTGFIGKWGLGGPIPVDRFDVWNGFGGQGAYFPNGRPGGDGPKDDGTGDEHLTDIQTDQAVSFLEGAPKDRPFFLQISTKAAHVNDSTMWDHPFPTAARFDSVLQDAVIARKPTDTPEGFEALPEVLKTSEARLRWESRFGTEERFQQNVKDYYRLILGIDELVQRVRNRLEELGQAENTVIIFSSDHGFYLSDRGLAGKWFMHEESIRVPLVIYDPRAGSSSTRESAEEIVLNIDLAPTILDYANVSVPDVMQGESLRDLTAKADPDWRTEFFYEHHFGYPTIPFLEGVRQNRWKYVRYATLEEENEELFDLENDPLELKNLAADPAHEDDLDRLRSRWRELREEAK